MGSNNLTVRGIRWPLAVGMYALIMVTSPGYSPAAPVNACSQLNHSQDGYGTEIQRELEGKLVYSQVHLRLFEVSTRDAFMMLSKALGVTIIGRWSDDKIGHGLDPDAPITLEAINVSGMFALEMILDQATLYEPCIWNLRKGYIEVGTKERLSNNNSKVRHIYNISDFLLEPPYFKNPYAGGRQEKPGTPASGGAAFNNSQYRQAALYVGKLTNRKTPESLGLEIIRGIIEMIEPGNWDYGDLFSDDDPDSTAITDETKKHIDSSKIASVRIFKKDKVIVTAPDYIHRQIQNPLPPIMPDPITDDEITARNESTVLNDSFVHLLNINDDSNKNSNSMRSGGGE